MMIPEAVTLILQSFMLGNGGEIFVLDMGESVKIVDLAEKLILLSGKVPYEQVEIKFTGMRPGEKLYEEVFHDAELLEKTDNEKIFKSDSRDHEWDRIVSVFDIIATSYQNRNHKAVLQQMMSLVPEYRGAYSEKDDFVVQ